MLSLAHDPCPLIAILRGLSPDEAPHVGQTLFDSGFRYLEVPLNRPGALDAIRALRKIAPPDTLVGGGTVLTIRDVDAIAGVGGQLVVSPNCEPDVIRHAVQCKMLALPGVATPTEAYRGLAAGAHGLKLFPAELITPAVVKAMRSILPPDAYLLPVGGIHPQNMAPYIEAGANGFGIGGQLYKPGIEPSALKRAAEAFMLARQSIIQSR